MATRIQMPHQFYDSNMEDLWGTLDQYSQLETALEVIRWDARDSKLDDEGQRHMREMLHEEHYQSLQDWTTSEVQDALDRIIGEPVRPEITRLFQKVSHELLSWHEVNYDSECVQEVFGLKIALKAAVS